MEAAVDPIEKLRGDIDELLNMIDDALDEGADEATLRAYVRLLRERKLRLVQLEKAEINRKVFRFP
jgi:hypothetical protein